MNRRKLIITVAVSMVVVTLAIAGLAYFSGFPASAFVQDLPVAVHYLPSDSQAVFGMNVRRFTASPLYAQFMDRHGQEIGADLAEFIANTGVDPRRDVRYIIAAGRAGHSKGTGVVIAVGDFNPAKITEFIRSKGAPVRADYKGANVLVLPAGAHPGFEKGIAFLSDSEIALGTLDSIHAVLDVRSHSLPSIDENAAMAGMLAGLDPQEMFWFAGDAAAILSQAPAKTPMLPALSSVQTVFGTMNLTAANALNGKVTVTAINETAAGQLADFVTGLVALGNLASAQNPELAELIKNVQITRRANQFDVALNVPFELLQQLEVARGHLVK